MTDDPRLTPLAASLPATVPFVGPEAQERARGLAFRARLGANESVFGPSPKAIAAMQAARLLLEGVSTFGDTQWGQLQLMDGLKPGMRAITIPKDPACKACNR